ncbi:MULTISPECIES: hypothetical protein [unclassified Nocardia]|uniref:hypothetical protein n=1 Tax=unclassified Nocardia TaxID=2637762 RepID=UPI001CE4814F|nr:MULTISPECIES: hypothetical protein [unclassified Nocardia]
MDGTDQPQTLAEQLRVLLEQLTLLADADEAVHGIHHLTVETGYPETADDLARIEVLCQAAWTGLPQARALSVGGGGDYTTIRLGGPAAAQFLEHLATTATRLDPGWWRIRRSSR